MTARIPLRVLRRYLLEATLPRRGCRNISSHNCLFNQTIPNSTVPFRKQLKDEAKRRKAEASSKKSNVNNQTRDEWELTVGIEIHAQLNTARKLFSAAPSTINDPPNTQVALFDLAMPGSQPQFQKETIIPALRAALALNCAVQRVSRWDRKHYFHWDQPAGYQITQYYEPFARNGYIDLYAHDGIAKEDGSHVRVGIKQVQMEQDTAKTISQPGGLHLLDFNRVGLPLIEIITMPEMHHPRTAAALVRKIQILLAAVDACVLGMQSGGLRADVNVSVRRRGAEDLGNEYAGVSGLGQRTEIKNLSSFKSIEDAIIAERDRQITLLELGGVVEGETRGWTIGSTETRRLRGKEGEVDYRYMPDPDLGPVIIGDDLVSHLEQTLGVLPDAELEILTTTYGVTMKDAMALVSLDDGGRVEYFRDVIDHLQVLSPEASLSRIGRLCNNWVLHELGGLASDTSDENALQMSPSGNCIIPAEELALLIHHLDGRRITGPTAKSVLQRIFKDARVGTLTSVDAVIEEAGLWFQAVSAKEYDALARKILDPVVMRQIQGGQRGKINLLVGKMMRADKGGRLDPKEAGRAVERLLDESIDV